MTQTLVRSVYVTCILRTRRRLDLCSSEL